MSFLIDVFNWLQLKIAHFQKWNQNFLEVSHENFVSNYDLETLKIFNFMGSTINQVVF